MYSQINIVRDLEPEAEKFILDNDRLLYRPFFEEAEKFCAGNNVLIGGRVGIDLLVGKEITHDSFFWELYCDDTFNTAKALADALSKAVSPHVPARTVALRTDIRHREFTLSINARFMFKIYSMDRYRGLKLVDIMGPAVRDSYFAKIPIKCISEEMQLIEIYRTLYTPSKISMWKDELENENKIYGLIRDSLGEKATTEVSGGREFDLRRAGKDIQSMLLRKVLSGKDNVLIGDHALTALGIEKSPSRIQFISAQDIDSLRAGVEKILASDRKLAARIKITYVKYPLNIPSDFQILKYTLYASDGKEQTPIADVFNSAQFEMIPFTMGGSGEYSKVRIGNPWVLLRFLFIDIWTLKLILNISTDNPEFIKNKIKANIRRADLLRKEIMKNPVETFQLTNYIGTYINETIAKKKLIKEIGERFPVYYPAKAKTVLDEEHPAEVSPEGEISGGDDESLSLTHIIAGVEPPIKGRLKSSAIDLSVDVDTKLKIMKKFLKKKVTNLEKALEEWKNIHVEYSRWGVHKKPDTYFYKNADFLPFIPSDVNVFVDIGCGSGIDIAAIKKRYMVKTNICVDIDDFREKPFKNDSEFVKVELDKPLALKDGTADLVTVFHSIHHMADSVESRLKDIARITKQGGVVFIKDHDVGTRIQAGNVDFEHFVYEYPHWKGTMDELMTDFGTIEPMYYYRAEEIDAMMKNAGFERVWTSMLIPRTYVYGAVYRKK